MAEDKDRIRNDVDDDFINVTDAVGTTVGVIAGAAGGSLLGPLGTVAGAISGSVIGDAAATIVDDLANEVDLEREE